MARPRKLSTSEVPQKRIPRKGVFLWLEWLMFFVLLVPYVILSIWRKLVPSKYKSIDGRVVLVTGAAQGLGRELALRFASHGCKVACVDIDRENVLETAAEIVRDGERARAYATNVANVEEIKVLRAAVTKDLGPVDILVNNASLVYYQKLDETSDEAVKALVDVNVLSYIWMVRQFLPGMKERDSGHVVAVSSLAAHTALANASVYTTTKWAVRGFMESLRQEVLLEGYKNIYFTTVCPTFMDKAGAALNPRQKWISKQPTAVAAHIIAAVRRNLVSVCVPEYLYYLCLLGKLLPTSVSDWVHALTTWGEMEMNKKLLDKFDPIIKDTVK